uniref:Uncharacterized protein n=1 Tax=Arundo donax TaxID=35708 RepID=A0A0A9CHA1_ARUDO
MGYLNHCAGQPGAFTLSDRASQVQGNSFTKTPVNPAEPTLAKHTHPVNLGAGTSGVQKEYPKQPQITKPTHAQEDKTQQFQQYRTQHASNNTHMYEYTTGEQYYGTSN